MSVWQLWTKISPVKDDFFLTTLQGFIDRRRKKSFQFKFWSFNSRLKTPQIETMSCYLVIDSIFGNVCVCLLHFIRGFFNGWQPLRNMTTTLELDNHFGTWQPLRNVTTTSERDNFLYGSIYSYPWTKSSTVGYELYSQ